MLHDSNENDLFLFIVKLQRNEKKRKTTRHASADCTIAIATISLKVERSFSFESFISYDWPMKWITTNKKLLCIHKRSIFGHNNTIHVDLWNSDIFRCRNSAATKAICTWANFIGKWSTAAGTQCLGLDSMIWFSLYPPNQRWCIETCRYHCDQWSLLFYTF